ncbi:hypothetical protein [Paenibacillus alvei]|uniref:Uncharacterized protein n=1 Tax=Paenibacillus alvei TaxID=44250 RepID=A0A383RGU6_PAEAL|nr:hypothetical protein [Paenibacillus alvei]SYX85496.1 conserved exported protein of unknown function [Paenibacillus alvei]
MKIAIATINGILVSGSMNFTAEAASSRSISDITLKTAVAKPKAMSEGEKLEKAVVYMLGNSMPKFSKRWIRKILVKSIPIQARKK